jgi:hypothetical protein
MSNVEDRQTDYRAAEKEVDRIKDEIRAAIRAATDAIHEANRDRLHDANVACSAAQRALDDARVAEMAAKNPMIGKKMQKTTTRFVNRWSSKQETETTFGILEMRVAETRFPLNMRYGLPLIGSLFIRICKKDGSVGSRVDTAYRAWEEVK